MLEPITGVCSRRTPLSVNQLAKIIGDSLSSKYQLRTNAVQGLNGCFTNVKGSLLYLPYKQYQGLSSSIPEPNEEVVHWANGLIKIICKHVPVQHLHRLQRNVYSLLGYNSGRPSKFVIYYHSCNSDDKEIDSIEVDFVLKLARYFNIPIYNIMDVKDLKVLKSIKEGMS